MWGFIARLATIARHDETETGEDIASEMIFILGLGFKGTL